MDLFRVTMQIVSALIMVYVLLIMLRVIISWLPGGGSEGTMKIRSLVMKLTDPYMNRFQGFSRLRFGMFDFSPVLGIMILFFMLFVTQRLASGDFPSLRELLIWLTAMVWGIIAFLVTLAAALMLIRLVSLYTVKGRPMWTDRLDSFLFPRVSRILGFFTNRTVSYRIALGVSALVLLVFCFGVGWLMKTIIMPWIMRL